MDPQNFKEEPISNNKTIVVTDEKMLDHAPFY